VPRRQLIIGPALAQHLDGRRNRGRTEVVDGTQHPARPGENHVADPRAVSDERLRRCDLSGIAARDQTDEDIGVNGVHICAERSAGHRLQVRTCPRHREPRRGSPARGDPDEAQRHADRGLTLARDAGERGWEAWTLRLHGEIAARRGLVDDAKAHYLSALALAEPRGMRPLIAHCQRGLGRMARRIGNRTDAAIHLATAASMYHDMGMTLWSQDMAAEIT
jgi:tetratricopeptide (TPR) repeat protein